MNDLIKHAQRVAALLKERKETIAVSESSAGGLITASLLAVPGASAYCLGGVVLYTRQAWRALRDFDEALARMPIRPAESTWTVRSRIELVGDKEMTRALPSRQGIVELELKDGRELRHHTKAVRGTAQNPMTRAEVDEKAYHLMAPVLGKARARKLCDAAWTLDRLPGMRKLRPLLAA